MRYCSLDLEMEQPCGHIIQIGAVVGDIREKREKWRRPDSTLRFDAYARPFQCCPSGQLSGFIKELCHIDQDDYEHTSNELYPLLHALSGWLRDNEVSHILQWGYHGADWKKLFEEYSDIELIRRMQLLEAKPNPLPRLKDINVKQLFQDYMRAKGRPGNMGLAAAAEHLGVEFYGFPHDALNDAATTVLVYKELLRRIKNGE